MRMFFVLFASLFMCLVGAAPRAFAELDEWGLDDSYGGFISLSHTYIDGDNSQNSISATFPFIQNSRVHTYLGEYKQNFDDGESALSQDLSMGVTTDPYAVFSADLHYDKFGKNSSITVENTILSFDFDVTYNIELIVRGLKVDINVQPGVFSEETQALLDAFGLLSDGRKGGGLELRYLLTDWQWGLSYNYYDYDGFPTLSPVQRQQLEDSIRLDSFRFALYLWLQGLDDRTTERYRRAFVVSTLGAYRDAFQSKSILAQQDAAVSAYWYADKLQFQFTVLGYESYIEEAFHAQVSFGTTYQFHDNVSSGFRMIYVDESSQFFAELSLGLSW